MIGYIQIQNVWYKLWWFIKQNMVWKRWIDKLGKEVILGKSSWIIYCW